MSWLARLAAFPGKFGFHATLRRFEAASPARLRLGDADSPRLETLRLGQIPSAAFEPEELTAFEPEHDGKPPRLSVGFFGLWGPEGPLPGHLTEYVRERLRNAGDPTLARFVDIFHHRMLLLFHKAWARSRPTVSWDRPESDAFPRYVQALIGHAGSSAPAEIVGVSAEIHYASLFAGASNPEGLRQILADHFALGVRVEEFVGRWLDVPEQDLWHLGGPASILGQAMVGRRAFSRTQAFRVVLGPMSADRFREFLPDGLALPVLARFVRLYTKDEWAWDVQLLLAPDAEIRMQLGRGSRLGWTTCIGKASGRDIGVVVDPERGQVHREIGASQRH